MTRQKRYTVFIFQEWPENIVISCAVMIKHGDIVEKWEAGSKPPPPTKIFICTHDNQGNGTEKEKKPKI